MEGEKGQHLDGKGVHLEYKGQPGMVKEVIKEGRHMGNPTYSHDGPIRRGERGYVLMTDQSDTGSAGIFS
eukprot:2655191-Pyramimonas_sp.AAC.1